ncbi:MAG TPA: choice-of-anchor D domain-containing protein [Oligoflexus sp.]|uniref:Ig-like domain-containing protein n=1 Tax=Oligoflexus sp. TaxID=1971216 RepID=UPI002D7F86D8|nr:choice-of-anchor D domain-containing protein [Oligoflexus sp.]HET9239159.1 choice-of-anchor D domain-containing protein [Oligoflexus sp.]
MLKLKILVLVLASLLACTPKSKPSPTPTGSEGPSTPGPNLGKPGAIPAKLAWEVVDATKFSQCSGSLTAELKLKNSGETAASWTMKQRVKSGLAFVPAQGTLKPREELTIVVTGTLTAADLDLTTGRTNIEVSALYENGEAPLKIQEALEGVLLQFNASTLDFGVVTPKDKAEQQLTLTNLGKTDTQIRFGLNSDFAVNPGQLDLAAGTSKTISVSFQPLENRSYSTNLLWQSSKPICTALSPSVKLQGQGSTVFKTTQKSLEWNQSCSLTSGAETQDISFSLRKNVASDVSLESIEGPFTVDAKEWTIPANAQGTVKVFFDGKELRPGTYKGRLSLRDKASGETVSFDLQATVIGSYVEVGTTSNGAFTPFDPIRGMEFTSSQAISSYASHPFNVDFVNRGNRPAVVTISLKPPVTAPFINFPETKLTIQPGLARANSFPLWLQTHQVGTWDTLVNFRFENDAAAPLCRQPAGVLPLHYTVNEDLDVEASAQGSRYICGASDQPEFSVDLTNHSSRTVQVGAAGLWNKSRINSQFNSSRIEGVTFKLQSRDAVGTSSFINDYSLKKGETIRVIIQVSDRTRFESTFKAGEKVVFGYSLRPGDSGNSISKEIALNVDVSGAFLALSPLELNFGTVVANAKAMQSFQIKNEGTAPAALTLPSLGQGFSLVSPASNKLEIGPAETALVTVAYTGSPYMSGRESSSIDAGGALNSCYSTGKVVSMRAVSSMEGLSFEPGSSSFGLGRSEPMGKPCAEVPIRSFSNRLRNMSSQDLKYRVSIRLNESLRPLFAASDLMAVQVNGQQATTDMVFTASAQTMSGQGPALSLVWLQDISALSFEKYRILAETEELGKVVVTYDNAEGADVTLPIKWSLARIIPSAKIIDVGTLTTRGSVTIPYELNVLQNHWTYVDITTEFKDGSPGLTVTPASLKLHSLESEVLRNPLQVKLDAAWQAASLSGTLKITAKESQTHCPLVSEFNLPVKGQVKIKELVVDSGSPRLTVTPEGKDFRVTSTTDCGTRSDQKTIRIKNNGNFPISFLDFQWEELAEASPFILTSSPSELQKTLEPGATLSLTYQPLEAQRQNYYAEDLRTNNRGVKRKLKATVSEDGEVREVNFIISDMPVGFYLPKTLFTTVPSFRQIQMKGNVAMKVPDFMIPVTGRGASYSLPGLWTVSSDIGQVQTLDEQGQGVGRLGAVMEFPAGFSGTSRMTWTVSHATLKSCSPNSFAIEGTKTSESIDVSLDPGNTVVGTPASDDFLSGGIAAEDGRLTSQVNFDRGKILCGTNAQEQFINITNNTSQTVKILIPSSDASPWLPIQMSVPPIEPGMTGRIRVAVDSSQVETLGSGLGTGRYTISLVANSTLPSRTVSSLRVIQTAEIEGKIVKAYVDGKALLPGKNIVNFGEVARDTTATRDIEWIIQGASGNNQLEFRKSLVAPISDGTPEFKLLEAFGSTIEREIFTVDSRRATLSFRPSVTGDHSVKLEVVGGPAMENVCSAPTIIVKGQGK